MRDFHQFHIRLVWCSPPFSDVAVEAAANDVFPRCRPATAFGHHVVKTETMSSKSFTAILAAVFVSQKNIPTVELHSIPRHAIIPQ